MPVFSVNSYNTQKRHAVAKRLETVYTNYLSCQSLYAETTWAEMTPGFEFNLKRSGPATTCLITRVPFFSSPARDLFGPGAAKIATIEPSCLGKTNQFRSPRRASLSFGTLANFTLRNYTTALMFTLNLGRFWTASDWVAKLKP